MFEPRCLGCCLQILLLPWKSRVLCLYAMNQHLRAVADNRSTCWIAVKAADMEIGYLAEVRSAGVVDKENEPIALISMVIE